jgi:anti-sigma B factor antagonist
MDVTIKEINDITVIEAEGNIDSRTAGEFEKKAVEATKDKDKIIIDLSKVDFLSSAGLRALLILYRQVKARNGKIVLVGVSEEIQDVMENTGFINFFILADHMDDGVKAIV